MSSGVILDTGPLVAFLDRAESHHAWACERFREFSLPLLTCEPVLTEALFLLRRTPLAQEKILDLVSRRQLVADFHLQKEIVAVRAQWDKYRDLPMSLADACLVRMAELTGLSVCTLDSHFAIYRLRGRDPVPLVRP